MNKKLIVTIVVLLLLGVGGFAAAKNFKGSSSTSTSTESSTQPTSANSLKALLALGSAQTCTFDNAGSTGTMYISGGKVRGDFDSTTNGKTLKTHMLVDGTTSYIWMDGEKTGYKMSFDASAGAGTPGTTTAQTSGAFDANADMNYKCGPWVADASVFVLPTTVTFTSFAIPTMNPSSGNGSSSSQCSYCDNLTGDAKTQCKSALNCK